MKQKIFKKQVKIGIAFITALFILYFGIHFLKGINIFKPSNYYIVTFDNVTGMVISDPVTINGLKIGQVNEMNYDPAISSTKIFVQIQMNKSVKIPKGSTIEQEAGMISSSTLILKSPSTVSSYLSPGDTIVGIRKVGMMDMFSKMTPQIEVLLPKLDSIMLHIDNLLSNPALNASLNNVEMLTAELNSTTRETTKLLKSLNQEVPSMAKNLNRTLENVGELTEKINQIDINATFEKLDNTATNIESLTGKLNSKDNSIGLLFNDRQLYDSINSVLNNSSLLLEDVRKNPSKYINIKVF